jgi:hypothetical protein
MNMFETTPEMVTAEPSIDADARAVITARMSTFVSSKRLFESRYYHGLMSTIVYLLEKVGSGKSRA